MLHSILLHIYGASSVLILCWSRKFVTVFCSFFRFPFFLAIWAQLLLLILILLSLPDYWTEFWCCQWLCMSVASCKPCDEPSFSINAGISWPTEQQSALLKRRCPLYLLYLFRVQTNFYHKCCTDVWRIAYSLEFFFFTEIARFQRNDVELKVLWQIVLGKNLRGSERH
jgi:hypothetical protein